MGTKVTATYVCSNAMDWIHLAPHGIAFQVTPELLRAYLAPDVDWGDWKPSLHDDGVAGEPEDYGEIVAVRHGTDPVEVLEPETWARRLAFHGVEADPATRIDWDTTSDPSNPGWVARQGRLNWAVQGCEPDATDAELVDAADTWAPAGVTVAAAEVDRTEAPERVTADSFRAILDGLGYYNGDAFTSPEQVREYLSTSNLLNMFGEVAFTAAALDCLAELAIEHREHWAEGADPWTTAVQVARECGAEWARQSPRPIPKWTGEPIVGGDWDAIEAALGTDPSNIDAAANQELIDAWLAGYEQARRDINEVPHA